MIWLVVACPQSRAAELERCLGSLQHDPAHTTVVTALRHDVLIRPHYGTLAVDTEDDFSLARLWNMGLAHAYRQGATEVAVIASDIVGHPDSLTILAGDLRTNALSMAGPAWSGQSRILHGPRTTTDRVPGACFMLAAEHGLLCDEGYRWWYTDDDLEMAAREVAPVGVFTGTGLALSQPDSTLTPERQAWAVEDRARFVTKWGCEPW